MGDERRMHRMPPRPSKEKHQQELEDLQAQIESLKKKQLALNAKTAQFDIKATFDAKIKPLKEQLDILAKERSELNSERAKKLELIKVLSANIKKKNDVVKTAASNVSKAGTIEERIINLERQIESGTITINEEKRIVAEISTLKKQRLQLGSSASANGASPATTVEQDKAQIDSLKAELDASKARKETLNAEFDAIKEQLNEIHDGKRKESSSFSSLLSEKKELKEQIDALFQAQRALKDEFKQKNDEWFQNSRAAREEEQERRKAEKKKEEAQRLQEAAEKALEDANIPAFTEEINLCNTLINFLVQYSSTHKPVAAAVESATSASAFAATNLRKVDSALPEGAVALKKKDDREEDFFMGGGKKGKGKGAKVASAVPVAAKTFKIDLATLELFGRLKLDIPTGIADIDASITTIEEKKAKFLADQANKTQQNKEAAEARIAALKAAADAGNAEDAIEALENGTDLVVEDVAETVEA